MSAGNYRKDHEMNELMEMCQRTLQKVIEGHRYLADLQKSDQLKLDRSPGRGYRPARNAMLRSLVKINMTNDDLAFMKERGLDVKDQKQIMMFALANDIPIEPNIEALKAIYEKLGLKPTDQEIMQDIEIATKQGVDITSPELYRDFLKSLYPNDIKEVYGDDDNE
jgi:hypothetical protein